MTELTWEGKYKDGKKVAPVRIALPFQTIETINESAADRQKRLNSLFNQKQEAGEWRNRLIWGDKKYVLPSLLPEFTGKVNLIYIDPPFNVGSDFSFTAKLGDNPETEDDEEMEFVKQPNILEVKAYRDTWGVSPEEKASGKTSLDKYLKWFYETVTLLRDLLAEDGSIFVHLDWHVGHYAKAILDEVFGYDNFINEIIWHYRTFQGQTHAYFARKHDTIFWYSKSSKFTYNEQFLGEVEDTIDIKRWAGYFNERNQIVAGKMPIQDSRFVRYLTKWKKTNNREPQPTDVIYEAKGQPLDSVWHMKGLDPKSSERVNYATQKPEALLERFINAASNKNDLILDCFCGSGTTAATAEKLDRKWITCDLGRFAIHTARKRFLQIPEVRPFIVQNLGKYERQQWVKAEFENTDNRLQQEKAYKKFIAELYHAKPLDGYTYIHGAKAGRMIHVGSVETPVTVDDIKAAILELWKLVGKEKSTTTNGIDFLGWDFAFDVNETAAQFAKSNKVDVKFKKIPREVLEKKAVEQGDIKFYELASLNVKTKTSKTQLTITLDNFIIPPDDIPEEVRTSITHWSQWIDYWSIDWDYRDDTFHNEWQSYRTKQNPKIELTANNQYEKKGKYTVLVKVIDILGNDTTKALQIEI